MAWNINVGAIYSVYVGIILSRVDTLGGNLVNSRASGIILMALRLLRCVSPYSEVICKQLVEDYYESSSIYYNLYDYVWNIVEENGISGFGASLDQVISDIESEAMGYCEDKLQDPRSLCIKQFNEGNIF